MEPDERVPVDPKTSAEAPPAKESKASTPSEQRAIVRYLDRPDMAETSADAVRGLRFDEQTLVIEFGVSRRASVGAMAPITGRRYPACRLVLPPAAAVELINKMQQIATALR